MYTLKRQFVDLSTCRLQKLEKISKIFGFLLAYSYLCRIKYKTKDIINIYGI